MSIQNVLVRSECIDQAREMIKGGAPVTLYQGPTESGVGYLLVEKNWNKENQSTVQQIHRQARLKRLTHWGKRVLLGKGFCAKVHAYQVDPVLLERLNPDDFAQYVKENTLMECNPDNIQVAQV